MARTVLTDISSLSWEHPADRAALNALRAIPGFQQVVNKIAGVFGERGIRHLFTANAVRVGPTQRPDLDALWTEVLQTLDWPTRPQLYVTQTPHMNAGAVGFGDPFVVINSAAIEHLTREELRVLLAHELGHIMSGHVTTAPSRRSSSSSGSGISRSSRASRCCRSRSPCSSGTARANSPATAPRCSACRIRTSCSPRS
jgi:hypothetical protein